MKPMKRLVNYNRVSTEDQGRYGYSLQNQQVMCQKWVDNSHDYVIVKVISEDITGTILERPGLQEALNMLSNGDAEGIICHVPDRLSRILHHRVILREAIFEIGELIFVNKGVMRNTPDEILMDNIDASIAQRELSRIRERTEDGRNTKARNGLPVGSGAVTYGYRMVGRGRDSRYEIDEEEAAVVQYIFELYIGGWSPYQIADYFTEQGYKSYFDKHPYRGKQREGWASTTIYNILKNETYIGKLYYRKTDGSGKPRPRNEWIEISVPPILEERVFYQAQHLINKKTWKKQRVYEYLLAGMLTCHCGYSLTTTYGGPNKFGERKLYYRCVATKRQIVGSCQSPYIPSAPLDEEVWQWISSIMHSDETLQEAQNEMQALVSRENKKFYGLRSTVESQINKHEQELQRLLELYKHGEFPIHLLNQNVKETRQIIEGLEKERDKIDAENNATVSRFPTIDFLTEFSHSVREKLPCATFEEKRGVMQALGTEGFLQEGNRSISITCYLGSREFSCEF